MEYTHISVMPDETIGALNIKPDGIYVDCTLGGAGHTKLILQRLNENGRVIGIDRDEEALINARETVKDSRLIAVKDNFENITDAVVSSGFEHVDGILMDLGVSSRQLDSPQRGFSYIKDAPLDMRMDTSSPLTAKEVVNTYTERELVRKYEQLSNIPFIAMSFYDKDGWLIDLNDNMKELCGMSDDNPEAKRYWETVCMFNIPLFRNVYSPMVVTEKIITL